MRNLGGISYVIPVIKVDLPLLDREFQKHHQNVLSACPHFVIGVFGCSIGVICLIRYSLV